MLTPIRTKLDALKIVLGSQSPRRRELLSSFFNFEVIPSDFDESTLDPESYETPALFVMDQANHKCKEIYERVKDADIVITADTVVVVDNKILGKPTSHQHAYEIIKMLSGRQHSVVTGVCILYPKLNKTSNFFEETAVIFDELDEAVIRAYADSQDPMDKAGAYGIQSGAMSLIKKIDGDYFNVVGLPVHAVCKDIYSNYA